MRCLRGDSQAPKPFLLLWGQPIRQRAAQFICVKAVRRLMPLACIVWIGGLLAWVAPDTHVRHGIAAIPRTRLAVELDKIHWGATRLPMEARRSLCRANLTRRTVAQRGVEDYDRPC